MNVYLTNNMSFAFYKDTAKPKMHLDGLKK